MKNYKNKRKKSQVPIALILIVLVLLFAINLNNGRLVMFLLFGLAFGIILQRSRFCFTSAFRDPVILKVNTMANYVLLTLTISVIGIYIINFIYSIQGKELVGLTAVYKFSFLTIVGAVLFGIGMVLASGCASGTLVRIGEGTKLQFISFIFFVLGSILGGGLMGVISPIFNNSGVKLFLPDMFGWNVSLLIQLSLIGLLYLIFKKKKY